MKKNMTIEEIKASLPDVKIKLANGEIVMGEVYGRNLDFAKVASRTWGVFGFDVSWHTIQHCINHDRPILL
jgi:hypothetical protein